MSDRNLFRDLIRFTVHAIAILMLAWLISYGLSFGVAQKGMSMEPTIKTDESVVLNRIVYHFHMPERYDIIAFTLDNPVPDYDAEIREERMDIKRIVGLPGERIRIQDGYVYINDEKLDDEKMRELGGVTMTGIAAEDIQLGNDEFFVLGDNRQASEDSRFDSIGNIKLDHIIGKVWFKTYPVSEAGRVR